MTKEERELLILIAEMTFLTFSYNQSQVTAWTDKNWQKHNEIMEPFKNRLNSLLRVLEATAETEPPQEERQSLQ